MITCSNSTDAQANKSSRLAEGLAQALQFLNDAVRRLELADETRFDADDAEAVTVSIQHRQILLLHNLCAALLVM